MGWVILVRLFKLKSYSSRIRGVLAHDNALYKSTFYLITYLQTTDCIRNVEASIFGGVRISDITKEAKT